MANARLVVNLVRLLETGAELTNEVKSSKEKFNVMKKLNDPSTSNKKTYEDFH